MQEKIRLTEILGRWFDIWVMALWKVAFAGFILHVFMENKLDPTQNWQIYFESMGNKGKMNNVLMLKNKLCDTCKTNLQTPT